MNLADAEAAYRQIHDLYRQDRREQAESHLRRFLQRYPRHPAANNLMAVLLMSQGRQEKALQHARVAASEDPRQVVYVNTLGVILSHLKRSAEAIEAVRPLLEASPGHAQLHNVMGISQADLGDVHAATRSFERAIELAPGDPQPRANLAKMLLDTGRAAESAAQLEAALRIAPDHRALLSHLAGALNYTDADPAYVLNIHRRLGLVLMAGAGAAAASPPRQAGARLRIGFLSSDFRAHSVPYFVEPLLAAIDRRSFEVFAYHAAPVSDDVTRRLRSHTEHWREVSSLDDFRLAQRIAQDRLDILIDLGGHTSGTRIGAMAYRPAPVQMNWCGYANTTGLAAVDYRIVDEHTDPPGAEALATERLLRLPGCFICYAPPPDAPSPGPAPLTAAGHITFGSFNMLPKIGAVCIDLWSGLLQATPSSRLVIKAKGIALPGVRERLTAAFADRGISAERLEFIDFVPSRAGHLSLYNRIDIALDTYPYNGTTTTCEAMWMGVPVVTLAGRVHAARVGHSLVRAVGLGELAAQSPAEFTAIAGRLAQDSDRLRAMRATLREQVARSVLCDRAAFAQRFGEALQAAWQAHEASRQSGATSAAAARQ